MIKDEIFKLRNELNKYIEEEANYDIIYQKSVQLDNLIAQFYEEKLNFSNSKLNN